MGRLVVLVMLALMTATSVRAQVQGPSVVGVVDFERVMRDSAAGQALRRQIDVQRSTFQAELAEQETILRAEEQSLKQQESSLAPDAFDQRRQAFQAKVNDAQRLVQSRKQTLDRAYGAGVDEIKQVAIAIVGEFAKERGFTLVIPLSSVLLVGPGYDITMQVLEELNKRLPTVNVSFSAE